MQRADVIPIVVRQNKQRNLVDTEPVQALLKPIFVVPRIDEHDVSVRRIAQKDRVTLAYVASNHDPIPRCSKRIGHGQQDCDAARHAECHCKKC